MSKRVSLGPADWARIIELRRQGKVWREIGAILDIKPERCRLFVQAYSEQNPRLNRERLDAEWDYKMAFKTITDSKVHKRDFIHRQSDIMTVEIPTEVLQDRDQRKRLAIKPRSFTSEFFGDPLPGYSALDRRDNQATT